MKNLETAMLVLMSEVGFVLTIIFVIWLVMMMKRKKGDEALTHKLVQQFKEEAPARRENLFQTLLTSFRMKEAEAQEKLKELVSREKSLYSRILKVFSGQDRSGMAELNEDIQSLISSYKSLAVSSPEPGDLTEGDNSPVAGNEEEIEKLRVEKDTAIRERDNLKKDLNTALDSIQTLQAEYEHMYGDAAGKTDK